MKRLLGIGLLLLLSAAAYATPANTPTLDGRPIEYDAADLRGTFQGESTWGVNGTLSNLFVTWDATYLYVALQAWQADNNKLVVLLDVDPGAGTGATTTTNWTSVEPSFIKYNDYGWEDASGSFGLDYMLASEGFYNNAIRVNYDGTETPSTNNLESLFDAGNGGTPTGAPVDMASVNDATPCPHKGFEARIPWAVLYEGTRWGTVEAGETVPRGATLHLLAGIHNNNPDSAWSSPDTIPNQTGGDYTNGICATVDYLNVTVDANNDGIPDMLMGDVNAPYIRTAMGAMGGAFIFVVFNETIQAVTAENTANWRVNGAVPSAATVQGPASVMLELAAPIATNFVVIQASGIEDTANNSRTTEYCLEPAASGIPQAVEVTFQVNTNSGMGISSTHARPSAFFLNGSLLPLEWGYPPLETTPLAPLVGSNGWATATVTFPPGSPATLHYKYSARINGTNNYEAIRLTDFTETSRILDLNTNGTAMTVVDYLGAAAHPLRNHSDTNEPSAQNRLFNDPQRGDAGVRVRREILFQLDLSLRKRDNLARVMVLGSDPLRGFNSTGNNEGGTASDYPGNSAYLHWDNAGIELFDDGTHGDATAGDGIYSRLWAVSTNGFDAAVEPYAPYSLVGGHEANWLNDIAGTEPYLGEAWWIARRSPRSMIYKFYVLTTGGAHHESPGNNLEYYIADPDETAPIELPPFLWDNDALPPPPPENAPVFMGVTPSGTTAIVQFENVLTEGGHGIRIATDLAAANPFADYGHRATRISTNGGHAQWSATITEAQPGREFYAAYAGPEPELTNPPSYWYPNYNIPTAATTVRVFFCQFKSDVSGMRSMNLTGTFSGWNNGLPMSFVGEGTWMIDLALPAANSGDGVKFKPRGGPTFKWYETGGDFQFIRGTGGVAVTPLPPVAGESLTITLDAAGTPLSTATDIRLHIGFDGWQNVQNNPRPAMSNTSGSTWEYTFEVPAECQYSIDWVFTDGTGSTWYSLGDWHAFMAPYFNTPAP